MRRARKCWVENKSLSGRKEVFAVRWNERTAALWFFRSLFVQPVASSLCAALWGNTHALASHPSSQCRWKNRSIQTPHPTTQRGSVCRVVECLSAMQTIWKTNMLLWCCGRHFSWMDTWGHVTVAWWWNWAKTNCQILKSWSILYDQLCRFLCFLFYCEVWPCLPLNWSCSPHHVSHLCLTVLTHNQVIFVAAKWLSI